MTVGCDGLQAWYQTPQMPAPLGAEQCLTRHSVLFTSRGLAPHIQAGVPSVGSLRGSGSEVLFSFLCQLSSLQFGKLNHTE